MAGPGIGDHRYEGYPLAEKHAWMQQGRGARAALDAQFELGKLAELLGGSDRALETGLRTLNVAWQGSAAEAAAGAVRRHVEQLRTAGSRGSQAAGTVDHYGSSFAVTKQKIAAPIDEGGNSFWGRALDEALGEAREFAADVFDVQSDYTRRVTANRSADTAANEALYAHQAASQLALARFPITDPASRAPAGPVDNGGQPLRSGGAGWTSDASGGGAHPGPGGGSSAATGAGDPGPGGPGPGAGPTTTGPDAPAGTEEAGWTPLTPPGAGGPVPVGSVGPEPAHGSALIAAPPRGPWAPPQSPRTSGYASTPPDDRELPGRGGGVAPGERSGLATPGNSGSTAGTRAPAGTGGMHPVGGAGAGGAGDRQHRNNTFLPSDEPFQVQFDDICPPVLGLAEGAEVRR